VATDNTRIGDTLIKEESSRNVAFYPKAKNVHCPVTIYHLESCVRNAHLFNHYHLPVSNQHNACDS